MSTKKIFDKDLEMYLYKRSEKEADNEKITYHDIRLSIKDKDFRLVRQTISERVSEELSYHIKSKKYAIEDTKNKGEALLLTESAQEAYNFFKNY